MIGRYVALYRFKDGHELVVDDASPFCAAYWHVSEDGVHHLFYTESVYPEWKEDVPEVLLEVWNEGECEWLMKRKLRK